MATAEQTKCVIDAVSSVKKLLSQEYRESVDKFVEQLNKRDFTREEVDAMLAELRVNAMDNMTTRRVATLKLELEKAKLANNVDDPISSIIHVRNQIDPETRHTWFSGLFGASKIRKGDPDVQVGYKDGAIVPQVLGEQSRVVGRLVTIITELEGKKLGSSIVHDPVKSKGIMRASLGLDTGLEDKVEAGIAEGVADAYRVIMDELIERLRAAGVPVYNAANYWKRQYDRVAILADDDGKAARAVFAEEFDPKFHPNADDAFDSMLKSMGDEAVLSNGKPSLTLSRKFFFRSQEGEFRILDQFAANDPWTTMVNSLEDLARRVTLAEQLSPRPWETADDLLDHAAKASREAGMDETDVKRTLDRGRLLVNYMKGDFTKPESLNWATAGRIIKGYQSVRLLGKTALYPLIIDPANAQSNLWQIELPKEVTVDGKSFQFLEGNNHAHWVNQYLQSVLRKTSDPDLLFNISGASNIAFTQDVIERFAVTSFVESGGGAAQGSVGRKLTAAETGKFGTQRMTSLMGQYNGSQWLTVANQRAASFTYQHILGRLVKQDVTFKDLSKIQPELHRRMREGGITDELWGRIAKSENVDADTTMLSPELIKDFQDSSVLAGFINRETTHMVAMPDVYSKAWVASKGKPGTVLGEVIQAAFQFHAIQMSFVRTTVARGVSRGAGGTVSVAVPMLLAGLALAQMKQAASGEPLYALDSPVLYATAVDLSGIAYLGGIAVRNIATSAALDRRPSVAELMGIGGGPAVEQAANAMTLGIKIVDDLWNKDRITNATMAKTNQQFWSAIPGQNYIAWHWATRQYAINEISGNFDYSTVVRRRQRNRKLGIGQ